MKDMGVRSFSIEGDKVTYLEMILGILGGLASIGFFYDRHATKKIKKASIANKILKIKSEIEKIYEVNERR